LLENPGSNEKVVIKLSAKKKKRPSQIDANFGRSAGTISSIKNVHI
jgi:hypothetical protein